MRKGVLGVVLLLIPLVGCGPEAPPPDILLVTIDTLRADRLGCYGYPPAQTPVLDRLAAAGVRFDQAVTPVPITLPAHASLFTGQLPSTHGVRNNGTYRLASGTHTLASALRELGYQTGAAVAATPVLASSGLGQGFDHYDDEIQSASGQFFLGERPASAVIEAARDWLRSQDNTKPLFLWVHLFEPHAPYAPPADFAARFPDDPYDGEIATADAAVGDLLAAWDGLRARPRLTVVTSDHGEGLGQHGEESHSLLLYESTVRVPLILHGPGVPVGAVRTEPVGLIDLAPTLLERAGGDPEPLQADGIVLDLQREAPRRDLLVETLYAYEAYRWAPLFALRRGSHKVVGMTRPRAYELGRDPQEAHDLTHLAPWVEELESTLVERISALTVTPREDGSRTPDAAELEALAALGYVGGAGSPSDDLTGARLLSLMDTLPDPTTRMGEFRRTARAEEKMRQGEFAAALDLLRPLVEENPRNPWSRTLLGGALMELGDHAASREQFLAAEAILPDDVELQLNLARLDAVEGRVDAARERYRRALNRAPARKDVAIEAARYEARLRRQDSDWAGVRSLLTPLRADLTQDPEAMFLLAEAAHRLGEPDEAARDYRLCLAAAPDHALAHNNLAWLLATGMSQPDAALEHAKRALELAPDQPDYHDTYLEVLMRQGNLEAARAHLEAILPRFPGHRDLAARADVLRRR